MTVHRIAVSCTLDQSPHFRRWQIVSDPAHLRVIRGEIEAFISLHGVDEKETSKIGLCLNEALANIIRHAYRGEIDRPIVVEAEVVPGEAITIAIRDWGSGESPADPPLPPHNPLIPGGLGMICLRKLMDEVVFAPQPDGMLLTMTKRLRIARDDGAAK